MYEILLVTLEFIIRYTTLGVIIALVSLLVLLVLISERERVEEMIKVQSLKDIFERLCEFSDNKDAPYARDRPFGQTMWLTRLLWKGVIAVVGLLIIWGLVWGLMN